MSQNQTNTTNTNSTVLLELVYQKYLIAYLPIIIFMGITTLVGLIGNTFAFLFFAFKVRKTSTIIFIVTLSFLDILVCFMIITTIVDMSFNVYFKGDGLCKAMYFFDHWTVVSSVLILWVISIDRYRKICKPFGKQFDIRTAKIAVVLLIGASLVSSIPTLVTYDVVKVNITVPGGTNRVLGNYCTNTDKDDMQVFVTVFHIIDAFMIFGVFITFVFTYGFIWHTLKLHTKQLSSMKTTIRGSKEVSDKTMTSNLTLNMAASNASLDTKQQSKSNSADKDNLQPTPKIKSLSYLEVSSGHTDTSPGDTPTTQRRLHPKPSTKTSRSERNITIIMFAVSIGFVLCFTPYFFVNVLRILTITDETELEAWLQFLLRSPFYNSVINPVIYCFFNPQFRLYIKQTLSGCKSDNLKITSFS